ncbi:hypothetical protein AAE02nite_02380 [Adhaeribacter aerolatus]|uniref:STAS domain-containing protein n=1 Tax=Adhaeribacter aerolatus TaxID=670289 RepID=A0A512AS84_9BACT|nr:hypothetical protein [Adhaeribacter aerolatus]GEO02574.1 hypothetical protein AAE02nite_02380 [Adhaeribacter aerolatus]
MQTFIQVNIENTTSFSFQRPLLSWLKARNPEMAVLDLDSFSDEMLVKQAGRLIQEAVKYAVYFKVAEPDAKLGAAFKLLEEIIGEDKPGLILLEGTHARLTAILQSRPHLQFNTVPNPEEVKQHLDHYFNPAN